MQDTGVLLIGHGTVTDLSDMPAFLQRIRRGRPAPPDLVAEITRRYRAIGGSPLLAWTDKQARALEVALGVPVGVAMRLWDPSVADALADLSRRGARRVVVLPLAPFSVHVYLDAVARDASALRRAGQSVPELLGVSPWGVEPALVAAHADAIRARLDGAPATETELVLTAHSLPSAVLAAGDPYQRQFEEEAHAVLAALGRPGTIAYQSQGADGGDWLGPDLLSTLDALGKVRRRVLIAPIGFLSDHVETLYDLDIEARARCMQLGLEFARVPALNDASGLIDAMANVVRRALVAGAPLPER